MLNRTCCALLASFVLLGCPPAKQTPAEQASPDPAPAADAPEDPRRAEAKKAAKTLGGQLKARLGKALEEGGLGAGIAECKAAAPEITAASALKIGRTSFKLRNPKNAPPEWAKASVEARVETPTFSDGPDGSLRALLPIRLEGLCVACHGPKDALSEEVRAALAKDYPDDQATGFAAGDLRGWFWVEVPATR